MGTAMSSFFGRNSRSQCAITSNSPESIPRELSDLLSDRYRGNWEPKFREYCQEEDLKEKIPKRRWRKHLLEFVLCLCELKGVLDCDKRTIKMANQSQIPSIRSPPKENISSNVTQKVNKTSKKNDSQIPELDNIQNQKRLLCAQIHDRYFNDDSESHRYLIPMSDTVKRTRLSSALSKCDETSNEVLYEVIYDAMEDSLVWIRLSELCDKFLKKSVLQSQANASVPKSVAVLLSIL